MTRVGLRFPTLWIAVMWMTAIFLCVGCGPASSPSETEGNEGSDLVAGDMGKGPIGGTARGPRPLIEIQTELGSFRIELWPHVSPHNVARFLELATDGTYNGTTFHRAITGYLIQGGDPNSKDDDPANDGYGGFEDRRLAPEFSDHNFKRGTVAMARDYRLDGASCQFFVTIGRAAHLDGTHTVIGEVSSGIEVVDAIAELPGDSKRRPNEPPVMMVKVISP